MKIIRINKGRAVNLPIRLVAIVIVFAVTVKLMDTLQEPMSIFIAIAIATIVPILWFSYYIIIINEDRKTIFDGIWTMGYKLGKEVHYGAIDKIFINKVKTRQTLYSLSNRQNIISNHEYRAYLKLDNGDKYYLFGHPLEKRVEEKVTKIRKKLGLTA